MLSTYRRHRSCRSNRTSVARESSSSLVMRARVAHAPRAKSFALGTAYRITLALALFASLGAVEFTEQNLERIKLTDGRVFDGWYDHEAATLWTMVGTKRVALQGIGVRQIAERTSLAPQAPDPKLVAAEAEARERERAATERAIELERRKQEAERARIDAEQRRSEEEAQRRIRVLARDAATHWARLGRTFDPETMTAEDMAAAVRAEEQAAADAEAERQRIVAAQAEMAERRAALERERAEQERMQQIAREAAAARRVQEEARKRAEIIEQERRATMARAEAQARAQRERAEFVLAIVLVAIGVAVWLLPMLIAILRKHPYRTPIMVLTVVPPLALGLGWYGARSVLGNEIRSIIVGSMATLLWIGALTWAVMPIRRPRRHENATAAEESAA